MLSTSILQPFRKTLPWYRFLYDSFDDGNSAYIDLDHKYPHKREEGALAPLLIEKLTYVGAMRAEGTVSKIINSH